MSAMGKNPATPAGETAPAPGAANGAGAPELVDEWAKKYDAIEYELYYIKGKLKMMNVDFAIHGYKDREYRNILEVVIMNELTTSVAEEMYKMGFRLVRAQGISKRNSHLAFIYQKRVKV